jgi:hypothetical protein
VLFVDAGVAVPKGGLEEPEVTCLPVEVHGKGVTIMPSSALTSLCRVPDYAEEIERTPLVVGDPAI